MIEIRLKKSESQMNSFYAALGLGPLLEDSRRLNKLLRSIVASHDEYHLGVADARGRRPFEMSKGLGNGFGITIYGYIRQRETGSGIEETSVITDWQGYATSQSPTDIAQLFVDREPGRPMVAYCEDSDEGNGFEFLINNRLAAHKLLLEQRNDPELFYVGSADVAMLCIQGTIILPVEKDEENDAEEDFRSAEHRSLLEQARMGDENAEALLHEREMEMAGVIRERLKTEDMLSVFESYLLSLFEGSGIFNVLADISDISYLKNNETGATVVRLTLCSAGVHFDLFIDEERLLGMPMVGMRFIGTGILQGRIHSATQSIF